MSLVYLRRGSGWRGATTNRRGTEWGGQSRDASECYLGAYLGPAAADEDGVTFVLPTTIVYERRQCTSIERSFFLPE